MRGYTHITREERYQIEALLQAGHNQTEIARQTGYCRSTISRELSRNRAEGGGYAAKQAHALAKSRWRKHGIPRWTGEDMALVEEKLGLDWSPEQISGRLRRERAAGAPSCRAIYDYIARDRANGGELWKRLRRCRKRYKRRGKPEARGRIRDRRSIDERPPEVARRLAIGHWEGDLMAGKAGHWFTATERHSRLTLAAPVKRKTAEAVSRAAVKLLSPFNGRVLSITLDNGLEFARFKRIERALEAIVYFAHPFRSGERGTNERFNGDLRQYSPKGRPMVWNSLKLVSLAMERLNNRPRKCLDWRTPNEVFFGEP